MDINTTQRGRTGLAYRHAVDEVELNPLRDEFAHMIPRARYTTGMPLRCAMMMTITRDNLAFDPGLKRLYVASESGTVSVFEERGKDLVLLGSVHAPHAHSVAVDPRTHRVYLPLESIGGRPVLRIMEPVSR